MTREATTSMTYKAEILIWNDDTKEDEVVAVLGPFDTHDAAHGAISYAVLDKIGTAGRIIEDGVEA